MGFVSTDPQVGAYFGPHIFAGTPFEQAPVLDGLIRIVIEAGRAQAHCEVAGHLIEVELSDLSAPYLIDRQPAAMPPFYQQGVEMQAAMATLKVDGREIPITVPPVGISGGPAAVVSPNGVYAR